MKSSILFIAAMFAVSPFAGAQTGAVDVFNRKYIKETMIKAVNWQLANPKHDPRDWTNGAFYAGVYAAWETTRSSKIYDAMLKTGSAVQWRPGSRWYHADDYTICQMYIDLYRRKKNKAMLQPTLDSLQKFINTPFSQSPDGRQGIRWWWCDALFMMPPVMVKAGITTGNNELLQQSDKYFHECYDRLFDRKEHLFARDYGYVIRQSANDRWEANGKKIFWSRGNGWVMGGLVRVIKELPKDYPELPFYTELFTEMAARIVSLQQEDGLWRASLLDPQSYPGGEVSGSGFFTYALAWGINNGLLEADVYLPAVKKAWTALNGCLNAEGRIGWVQPIGADPRRNFSADSWEVYGTGAFLLAASEVIQLKNK
ncbi:MAG: glycoside hydrolase family 88 protein [Bacteroidales bacterium]|jgi:rhamnogalacturonyl hydrolase YesR|nr:glycoside hydrolase family 88 protein [Bacteroidales bacterium]